MKHRTASRMATLSLSMLGFAAGCGSAVEPEHVLDSEAELACAASPERSLSYDSDAELTASLAGKWQRCDRSIPGFRGEVAGVEFTLDHQWFALARDASGKLGRVAGFENRGEWHLLRSETGRLSFAFGPASSPELTTDAPMLTDAPRQLKIGVNPYFPKYVPLTK